MNGTIKVGLIGYGRMGKLISEIASNYDMEIGPIFTSKNNRNGEGIKSLKGDEIDTLIDFSIPSVVVENVEAAAQNGISLVIGTTGWYDQIDRVKQITKESNIGLFYTPNFSIGIHVLFNVVRQTVKLLDGFHEYDFYVHEFHHRQKKDSPSGTAMTLANIILEESSLKSKIETETAKEKISPDSLHVTSTRVGDVIGTHIVGADSEVDSLEIKHTAKNRLGFALGAVKVARWMKGRKGIYTMEDFLQYKS